MNDNYYKQYEPIFGSWYIKRKLGAGSFGAVYEIEREDFGVTYTSALKTITIPADDAELGSYRADGLTNDEINDELYQFTKELVAEFELMSKLKGNSNIVSYEDHQVIKHDNGIGWDILIRMELLTPLVDHIHNTQVNVRDVIKLGIDMCKALELCQKFNIIHRDIKPENIFISQNGDYKLGDFGIARQVEKTTFGLSKKGTYNYMAPEVYKGQEYGTSVDMYSLGIVLYRLLNQNRAPFIPPYPEKITHTKREQALIKRMSGEALPPPVCMPEGRLVEIIMKACAYMPQDRYSSPLQMREDLTSIMYEVDEYVLFNPSGDSLEIKSASYVATDTAEGQTEIMTGRSDGTEVMTDRRAEVVVNHDIKKESKKVSGKAPVYKNRKNVDKSYKKKKILAVVAAVCVIAALAFGISKCSLGGKEQLAQLEEAGATISLEENINVKEIAPNMSFYTNTVYQSENPEVVTVDENGQLLAIAEGSTRIKCESDTDSDGTSDIIGYVNLTVALSEAESAAIDAKKTELIALYNTPYTKLQSVIADSSIDQNNVTMEKAALETALSEFADRIDKAHRLTELTPVEDYYNESVVQAYEALNGAYDAAYKIAHPTPTKKPSTGTNQSTSHSSYSGTSTSGSSSSSGNSTSSGSSSSNSSSSNSSSSGKPANGGAAAGNLDSVSASSNSMGAPDIFLDF